MHFPERRPRSSDCMKDVASESCVDTIICRFRIGRCIRVAEICVFSASIKFMGPLLVSRRVSMAFCRIGQPTQGGSLGSDPKTTRVSPGRYLRTLFLRSLSARNHSARTAAAVHARGGEGRFAEPADPRFRYPWLRKKKASGESLSCGLSSIGRSDPHVPYTSVHPDC